MEKAPSSKRPRYDATFRAEALRLASESRSTLAAARVLDIDPKRLYAWQKAAQPSPPLRRPPPLSRVAGTGAPRGSARRCGAMRCNLNRLCPALRIRPTANAESLWSRLKTELLELCDWPVFTDLTDAQTSVADYFDYYNHKRRHSSIGYFKPYLFHQQLLVSINQFSPT